MQEFHPTVTDNATLLNNTQVGFFDFESMNLSLHSSFTAYLDYCWYNHKNIMTARWRWITYLLPNDKKERTRVSLWFHKTFQDELEMGLISGNKKGDNRSTSGNI